MSVFDLAFDSKYFGVEADGVFATERDENQSVSMYVQPNDKVKIYAHYGVDQWQDQEKILGLLLFPDPKPFSLRLEYNFDDGTPEYENLYGVQIAYVIAPNMVFYYTRTDRTYDYNQLRLSVYF